MKKKKVAFIFVHNSCRSQIVEALGFQRLTWQFPWAVMLVALLSGEASDDNWGLEDPTGKSDEEFRLVISQIEEK